MLRVCRIQWRGVEYSTSPPAGSGTLYLTEDPLGSTRLVTNASGAPAGYDDYLPFGEEIPAGADGRNNSYNAPDGVTRKFTGKERDAELAGSAMQGLDYFGARYFSAAQGRFTTPDWSATPHPVPYADLTDPQTLNLYAYVRNNPLNRADLDGHNDYTYQKVKNYVSGNGYRTDAQVKGMRVAQTARSHAGDKDWAIGTVNTSNGHAFKPGSNKCNEFVSDTVAEAGKARPTVAGTGKIPTAAQLADPNVKINGLSAPDSMSKARPGDVIAQDHGPGANGNEEGHAGIIVALPTGNSPGQTASANANQGGTIAALIVAIQSRMEALRVQFRSEGPARNLAQAVLDGRLT